MPGLMRIHWREDGFPDFTDFTYCALPGPEGDFTGCALLGPEGSTSITSMRRREDGSSLPSSATACLKFATNVSELRPTLRLISCGSKLAATRTNVDGSLRRTPPDRFKAFFLPHCMKVGEKRFR